MKCPNCGEDIEHGWKYCPKCGSKPSGFGTGVWGDVFENVFSRLNKDMQRMREEGKGVDKLFERDIEAMDIRPWFRVNLPKEKSSGFSIKIISGTGQQPKISVRTFGDVNREKIQRQIRERFGIKTPIEAPKEAARPEKPGFFEKFKREKPLPEPKFTEEPKTSVRRLDSKVVVDLEIPGVKSEEDIDIKELENSIEVKAIAGDKAYFKILTKPGQYKITSKKFEKGVLHLEFS